MEHSVEQPDHTPTEVVAQRMRELRRGRGWSAERLAEELARHGVEWNRGVVTKLETGRRASVSVAELLGLAAVFEVSPLDLLGLADPTKTARKLTYDLAMQVAKSGRPDYGLIGRVLSSTLLTADQMSKLVSMFQATAATREANYEAMKEAFDGE
jgi:transcriptional regulator with XRE-family HTH domain